MLEQVREAGAAGLFVRRTDVIPEVDRHHRQPVILGQDHVEAVRQRVFFEVDLGNVVRCRRARGFRHRRAVARHGTDDDQKDGEYWQSAKKLLLSHERPSALNHLTAFSSLMEAAAWDYWDRLPMSPQTAADIAANH